ncbi:MULTISPECIES: NAD(P)-dependent oxidoreductase [unclassified Actinotalea]|uniref:NAD-dependent epimerase/dehydratase family protein n=1 Tax=unclassified Actinotalea TaxID=2638618 RepID=UPI002105C668|nr:MULTISPECIES: NAD(P)-dependent oxidoreductase [unclassified Actinotalea]
MGSRRPYLITGAAGRAARGIRPILRAQGVELILLDREPMAAQPGETAVRADLTDAEAVRDAVRGTGMVVHLGGIPHDRPWHELASANVDGTRVVLEAAAQEGVRHVLVASSNHAVGSWPVPVTPVEHLPPRPDSYYGASKAAVEALGSLLADRHGLVVTLARIGTIEETPSSTRALSTWLSHADLVRLVHAAATHDVPGAHVVWAISRNTRRWFSLEPGHAIGYHPQDDAEVYAARLGPQDDDAGDLIGGGQAGPVHALGVAR